MRDTPNQQTYVCAVCDRRAYGCRRMNGLEEVSENYALPEGKTEERVCPRCWMKLKNEYGAKPL